MIDFREIQVIDNSFELTETIVQNEQLIKDNRQLINLGLTICIILLGTVVFFSYKKYAEDSKNKVSQKFTVNK